MRNNKKRTYKLSNAGKLVSIVVLTIFIFTIELYSKPKVKANRLDLKETVITENAFTENDLKRISEIRNALNEEYKPQERDPIEEEQPILRSIIFSHYSQDDGSGVGSVGAYGIGVDDFTVNHQGWYLYQDKVALACAHDSMGDIRQGYRYWDILELVSFAMDGSDYLGICIDKGGAMQGWGNETEQRIDIWIETNSNGFGLGKGHVYE